MFEEFLFRYSYFMIVILLVIGLYGMLGKRNLMKKLIGLNIFQTAIFLFFIEGSTKMGATVPVIDPQLGTDPANYVNPLPHVLIRLNRISKSCSRKLLLLDGVFSFQYLKN